MRSRPSMGRLLLGSTALAAVLAIAPAAVAQDAEGAAAGDGETVVVVTGIRNSLQTAAQVKRRASTFVDSITASDISTLPDLSVAEALSRVPGVTVTRYPSGGSPDFPSPEGRGNMIRGLGYVRSEFNGRDAFSANRGRALDWSSIPPELVGAVDVFKNSSADLVEGGIGGTINLRTLEPFDRRGFTASFSADATYTDIRKKWSPSYSVVLGNRWQTANGEFGLLGSYSTSDLNSETQGWQQGAPLPRTDIRFDDPSNIRSYTNPEKAELQADLGYDNAEMALYWANKHPDQLNGTVAMNPVVGVTPSWQLRTNEVDRSRESFYLAGQWRNDTTRVTLKYIRVETTISSVERTLESFPDYDTGPNTNFGQSDVLPAAPYQLSHMQIDPNFNSAVALCNVPAGSAPQVICEGGVFPLTGGLMTSGWVTNDNDSWAGGYGVGGTSLLGIGKNEKSSSEDFSANVKWRPGDRWFVELDAQYTKATATYREIWGGAGIPSAKFRTVHDLDNPEVEVIHDPRMGDTAGGFNSVNTRDRTSVYVAPTSMADPYAAYIRYGNEVLQDGEGDLYSLRADAQYDFEGDSWFKAVKFGARYAERSQTNYEAGQNWAGLGTPWSGGGYGFFADFDTVAHEVVDYTDFYRGGVVQGANKQFLAVRTDFLLDGAKFTEFLDNEPDFLDDNGNPARDWRSRVNADGSIDYPESGVSEITEKTTNFFVRFDFGKEFANGMSLDGNFGVRYSKTELASTGFHGRTAFTADEQNQPIWELDEDGNQVLDPDTNLPIRLRTDDAESRDAPQDFLRDATLWLCPSLATAPLTQADLDAGYTEATRLNRACPDGQIGYSETRTVSIEDSHWLPSFNLKWNLNDEMLIRFGASRNLSRPNVGDLRAYQVASVSTTRTSFPPLDESDPLSGVDRGAENIGTRQIRLSGGNPNLRPTTADSYDISFEWYFQGGTVSATAFKKDLQDVITYGEDPYGSVTLDGVNIPIVYAGPINQEEVSIQGVELAYQQFYDFLPGWMSHLGMQTNYTYIDATATPPPTGTDADGDGVPDDLQTNYRFGVRNLMDQSKHVFNLVGIYQDDKHEIRLAYNWRSEYLVSYRDYITGNPIFIEAAGNLDASYKYDVNPNLQLRVSAANLLDTKSKALTQLNANGDMYGRHSFLNDRRFVVGFRYQH